VFLVVSNQEAADKSYGIEVARLAASEPGNPPRREILKRHEERRDKLTEQLSPGRFAHSQPGSLRRLTRGARIAAEGIKRADPMRH